MKRAIRLKHSGDILFSPDDSFDENVLIDLLNECFWRAIPMDQTVLVTHNVRNLRFKEWGEDWTYRDAIERVPRQELEDLWKRLEGAGEFKRYTPANENRRSYWQTEITRRRASFPAAIGLFMYLEGLKYQ